MSSQRKHQADDAVTWIMPVRNGMPYLRETLESLCRQTHGNARVIAWDNGSTDGSIEELTKWIPRLIPGQVITGQPMGLGASLAAMVKMADTPFCARIDSDDICLPERLEKQVAFMLAHPEVAVLGSGCNIIDGDGQYVRTIEPVCQSDADHRWKIRFGTTLVHPSVMFRRQVILDAGNYRDIKPGQDLDLWCRVVRRGRLRNLAKPLIDYREHEQSVTATVLSDFSERRQKLLAPHFGTLFPKLDAAQIARVYELYQDNKRLDVTQDDLRLFMGMMMSGDDLGRYGSGYLLRSHECRAMLNNLVMRWMKTKPMVRHAWPMARQLGRFLTGGRVAYLHLQNNRPQTRLDGLRLADANNDSTHRVQTNESVLKRAA